MIAWTRDHADATFADLARALDLDGERLAAELRTLTPAWQDFAISRGPSRPPRRIEAPAEPLKRVQRRILDRLLARVPVSPSCHAFVPHRSIVTHARLHRNQRCLVNYDIADAFPSVSRRRTRVTLERRLGPIIKHGLHRLPRDRRDGLIELLTDLVTRADHLPQGAPTSGAILNLCLAPMDREVRRGLVELKAEGHHGLVYTRYADDLTISAPEPLPPEAEALLRRAIHQAGFRWNAAKIRRADRARGQALEVCGVQVAGELIRLPSRTLRRYRAILHRAFFMDPLPDSERSRIHGIAGLVMMIHGRVPQLLEKPWHRLQRRHDLPVAPGDAMVSFSAYGLEV